jgi:hypothetical protein
MGKMSGDGQQLFNNLLYNHFIASCEKLKVIFVKPGAGTQ